MTQRILILWIGIACATLCLGGELLPSGRGIDWMPGIPGGLEQYSTNYTQFCNVTVDIPGTNILAVGDGVTDDTIALQTAINLCPNDGYVYLPAGTYKTTNALSRTAVYNYDDVPHPLSIVIRGAGPASTRIVCSGTSGSIISLSSSSYGSDSFVNDTAAGATDITLDTPAKFASNAYVIVYMPNDSNVMRWVPDYMISCVRQMNRVVAKAGDVITLERPVYSALYASDYGATNSDGSTNVQVLKLESPLFRSGVEDLALERAVAAGTDNLTFTAGVECWVKNVESINVNNWHIKLNGGFRCEVRKCYVHDTWNGGGNSGYGVGLFGGVTDSLIEDNIFVHCRHSIITEYGGTGNVFGYNYSREPVNESLLETDYIMLDLCHHGGEPRYTLWEGNVVAKIGFDVVLGSCRWNTAFRNWAQREQATNYTTARWAMDIQRYNVSNNIIGNILCQPEQTAEDYTYTHLDDTSWAAVRRMGYDTDADTDDPDQEVFDSTIYHLNYDYIYGSNTVDARITEPTLPDSLYLGSKPSWFGKLAFPPFNPNDPPAADTTNAIPAQARYFGYDYTSRLLRAATIRAGSVRGP